MSPNLNPQCPPLCTFASSSPTATRDPLSPLCSSSPPRGQLTTNKARHCTLRHAHRQLLILPPQSHEHGAPNRPPPRASLPRCRCHGGLRLYRLPRQLNHSYTGSSCSTHEIICRSARASTARLERLDASLALLLCNVFAADVLVAPLNDHAHTITVGIGTQPQPQTLIVDTCIDLTVDAVQAIPRHGEAARAALRAQ